MLFLSTSPKRSAAVSCLLLSTLLNLLVLYSYPLAANEWVYTVVPGDNLWSFSDKYLDSVVRFEELRRMNNIENPRKMRPGSLIRVPMAWIESSAVPATVYAVSGPATLLRAAGATLELAAGERIFLGDTIRTGNNASIAMRFADGSEMNLFANAEVRFDHLSAHGDTGMADTRLRLLKGRLETRVVPASGPGSRFEIHTPSAVSAVRGTDYRAAVDQGSLASSVEVLEGSVAVSGERGKELIPKGFGTRVEKGAAPTAPRKLLAAPSLTPLPQVIQTLGWALQWSAMAQATAYRVEISASADFDTLLLDELTPGNTVQLPDLADGLYHLRMRAVDSIGLEGQEAVASFLLDARPQPPVALTPGANEIVRTVLTKFSWATSTENMRYHLQVANDEEFERLVVDESTIVGSQFESTELPVSTPYFWRLRSVPTEGDPGPWGPARTFERRPRHEPIAASVSRNNDHTLLASWKTAAPGLRYQAQIAFDQNFADIELDRVTEESSMEFQTSLRRTRYLRVRSIEAEGHVGPWGTIQRIDPEERNNAWLIPFFVLMILVAP